jgi:c-di-GMP-binding flagellar brake protein YcgR
MIKETLIKGYELFFPGDSCGEEEFAENLAAGNIITDPDKIINLLKDALNDETILEVQLEDLTRVFFCRVLDHLPDLEEKDVDGIIMMVEPEYTTANYLKEQKNIIITPLEPSIGNFLVSMVNRVLIRILSDRCAFELGCRFIKKTRVRGMPVLQCSFPFVVRKIKDSRPYRVKIPQEMELLSQVARRGKRKGFDSCLINISAEGLMMVNPQGKHSDLKEEENISMELYWPHGQSLILHARIVHICQLRDKQGIQYCFGVKFDLSTRALAREIEQLVASVQRARLRKLSDLDLYSP